MKLIKCYTDGGCHPNPGPGGWGVYIENDGNKDFHFGGDGYTTNNQMEMTAAIQALLRTPNNVPVMIVTDSEYVRKGITQWINGWKRNGWKTAKNEPVKNQELWIKLDKLVSAKMAVKWQWTKGHSGDFGNEVADLLASNGRKKITGKRLRSNEDIVRIATEKAVDASGHSKESKSVLRALKDSFGKEKKADKKPKAPEAIGSPWRGERIKLPAGSEYEVERDVVSGRINIRIKTSFYDPDTAQDFLHALQVM